MTKKISLGLGRMEKLMEKLRHPERRVKTIHIAGTNGKGSTTAFLMEMLKRSGLFVGTYTSPYWESPAEQIAINGTHVTEEELNACLAEIAPAIKETEEETGETVTEFERMTTAALYYFSTVKPVDIAVIETGLGGREDATNVIVPLVSVITNVSMDHQNFLGDTIRDISREKAGIIKSGVPVMTAAEGEALDVLKETAAARHAKLYVPGPRGQSEIKSSGTSGTVFDYQSNYQSFESLKVAMQGHHQVTNATLALMTLDYMRQYYAMMVDEEAVREGLAAAQVPGRMETVSTEPLVIVDTAHNPASVKALCRTIRESYENRTFTVLFASMKDKDYRTMLNIMEESFEHITVTSFDDERVASAEELAAGLKSASVTEDAERWLYEQMSETGKNEGILVSGSQAFAGEIRNILVKKK
ncbi:bifunctional folylpolyglutamate synthase/dihydrofolate synthase [Alteribacter natronophilus]|uniref:bifunctional folylpolyglutamate synthase/dihydrofolate synthase n=1 Tax=Alteribacter natronophilus TaxID=2583810 RepID=UPI00110DE996|nr:folylpolyglutamate synthase/dihydrofolate synthase family protein [Alteribacter natronophilus]TMW71602.1 bifunctional folylpolyglutamate synthase/dihydrofolate synthase [Alteribacter natronophilus]